jgi:hypothetical protein
MNQMASNVAESAHTAAAPESGEAVPTPHVRFVDKLRIVAGCAVAVWLMRTVGWYVISPADSEMGLTFLLNDQPLISAWIGILLLSLVSSVLGTVISGRRLPEAGMLVGCVGLAALVARGGTMQDVLAYHAGTDEASRQKLMLLMMVDTGLWAAILVANWLAVTAAFRWLWKAPFHFQLTGGQSSAKPSDGKAPDTAEHARAGWLASGATAIAALFLMYTAFGRQAEAPVLRGQIFGALFLGFWVIVMAVRYFVAIHDSRWYAAAPLLVALAAFALGYFNADMSWALPPFRELASTPPHMLARALPVEYLTVGLAGAIMGFWSGEKIEEVADLEKP